MSALQTSETTNKKTIKDMTDTAHPNWMKLASLPNSFDFYCDKMVNINPNEFITVSCTNLSNLQKYNVESNTFTQFIQNEKSVVISDSCAVAKVTFNELEEQLYFYTERQIHSFNLKTKQHNIWYNIAPGGEYFFFINNDFHIIRDHNKHLIASRENNGLKTIINTLESPLDIEDGQVLNGAAAIYISSKQCILLIGGYYTDDGPLPGHIWMYSLSSNKWTKINNISFPRFGFGAVLTSNQRYILLFGGSIWNNETKMDEESDNIFVIDMKNENNWKLKQSKLLCPQKYECQVLRTGGIDSKNETLVIGFVKDCFKTKPFENLQLPPMYIVSLIAKWFSAEMIHWITNDSDTGINKQYGIYLKHILLSLYD